MKVWSKTLTPLDLLKCAEQVNEEFPGAQVYLGSDSPTLHVGPRTRRIDSVHLRSKAGRYHPNPGTGPRQDFHEWELAASWTEWGWFLARVFERDPKARCGDYKGLDDFNRQTNGRFIDPRTPRERQVKREYERTA